MSVKFRLPYRSGTNTVKLFVVVTDDAVNWHGKILIPVVNLINEATIIIYDSIVVI